MKLEEYDVHEYVYYNNVGQSMEAVMDGVFVASGVARKKRKLL